MTLMLDQDIQEFIAEELRAGRFEKPEDVVRAAFARFMQLQRIETLPLDELEAIFPGFRQKVAEGIASADAGDLTDGDEFFAELEREEEALERDAK